jgi:predicted AlkP superfamily pyrophosphatase or phosphodiesterase
LIPPSLCERLGGLVGGAEQVLVEVAMRACLSVLVLALLSFPVAGVASAAPRLAVVISIDQFPYEYLERMRSGFRPEGIFLRLCDAGANFINCHHGHAFTKTAPGHSVQLTGAFPYRNGIINNDWFDPAVTWGDKPGQMYCVDDPNVDTVGTTSKDVGRSPRNLLVATVGDVLKLNRPNSRVFGLALKDRAAILMTGHGADAAFWLEGGKWVTSTYYRRDLPPYLRLLNEQNADQAFLGKTWSLLYPGDQYVHFYPDDAPFEGELPGSGRKFPHAMPDKPDKSYYTAMTTSPFGNDYTLQAARALIEGEHLGKRDATDLLCLNLSSNDYVGHMFGPHSLEVQDITFRTDAQLGQFVNFIERHLDGALWVLALTSDHGVAPVPEYAATLHLPAGRGQFNQAAVQQKIEAALTRTFGPSSAGSRYVKKLEEGDLYLDTSREELRGDSLRAAENVARDVLLAEPLVAAAYARHDLVGQLDARGLALQFQRSCHPTRSGNVLYALAPYQVPKTPTATHGSPWTYDTHVPLLLWGHGVRAGRISTPVTPAALAPTLSRLLDLPPPPACEVEAREEALLPVASANAAPPSPAPPEPPRARPRF